jgi:sugar O-acyltransferase (sialic acid O-acetyltransferase NeuD family)
VTRPLLLLGAGGFAREVAQAVAAINRERPTWELLGFLDDAEHLQGRDVDGTPVVGQIADAGRFPRAQLVACTGSTRNYFSRKRIVRRLGLPPERYATIVHPTASVARTAEIGPGTALLAHVAITARAVIGAHVAMMPAVVITHDNVVGDYVTFGAGVRLAGAVEIEEGAYVGTGAMVREHLRIGAWSLLGMGAIALDDVPPAEIWVGVPARRLRAVAVPSESRGAA